MDITPKKLIVYVSEVPGIRSFLCPFPNCFPQKQFIHFLHLLPCSFTILGPPCPMIPKGYKYKEQLEYSSYRRKHRPLYKMCFETVRRCSGCGVDLGYVINFCGGGTVILSTLSSTIRGIVANAAPPPEIMRIKGVWHGGP